MAADAYVVAVRRDRRELAPDDWLNRLSDTGASIVAGSERRAQITATPEIAERIRHRMGDYLLIEPLIEHRPIRAADLAAGAIEQALPE